MEYLIDGYIAARKMGFNPLGSLTLALIMLLVP